MTVDSIAIPLNVEVPKWLLELIDYNTLVNDNIGGFVYDTKAVANPIPLAIVKV